MRPAKCSIEVLRALWSPRARHAIRSRRTAAPIVLCTATHMHGGPYAYASHYALSGIRKLGACTSLASPNASHYAARRTPPPSKINRKRQYIHVIIACVTVRWPCGCLIRTTCHVYGLWISAGAPRPAEGGASSTYHVSALRIRPFHRKALPGGRCNGPRGGCLTYHVSRLRIMYLARARPQASPPPPPYVSRIRITHYVFFFLCSPKQMIAWQMFRPLAALFYSNTNPNCQTCESTCVA